MKFQRLHVPVVSIPILLLSVSACQRDQGSTARTESKVTDAAVTQYHLQGRVLATSASNDQITVKHGEIPGFMPAMTMVYKLRSPSDLQKLRPGDEIAAYVTPSSDDYFLDKVTITGAVDGNGRPEVLPSQRLMIGDTVPDVPLVNQDGKTIHLKDYHGKAVLITFIYTRCAMPTACPLITSHLAKVNDILSKNPKAYAMSHLISVSLDPVYDKPPVLREYGLAYLDDNATAFSHWEFADTTPDNLKQLADAFGLQYFEQDNQIAHTMQTTLIDRTGRVDREWPGSHLDPEEVASAVTDAAMQTPK